MAIRGQINFPGDKSISHRALMLAALCKGKSRISNLSTGEDIRSTRRCLDACGIAIHDKADGVTVHGGSFSDPPSPLNCGNSGTTARMLLGLLAGKGVNATVVGILLGTEPPFPSCSRPGTISSDSAGRPTVRELPRTWDSWPGSLSNEGGHRPTCPDVGAIRMVL